MVREFSSWAHAIPNDFDLWFKNRFEVAVADLRPSSSAGLGPMSVYGSTIGSILKHDGNEYDPTRLEMLRCTVRAKMQQIFDGTYRPDPIRVFVKAEPHKASKIAEGRFRLIMAVSMEDAMIDRMLYTEFMRRAVRFTTPVKIGYAPANGRFRELAYAFPGRSLSIDKQAWDFSVPEWLVELWRVFLLDLVGGSPTWWNVLHNARFEALYSSETMYQFSDGSRAVQRIPGIMKSGCFNTLLLNSVGQYMISWLAYDRLGLQMREFWTIGDDTVESEPENVEQYVKQIQALGFTVKDVTINNFVEFCGFWATTKEVKPAYWRKHLFKAFYEGGEHWADKITMYQFLYAFDDQVYPIYADLLAAVTGVPPVPAELWRLMWRGVV